MSLDPSLTAALGFLLTSGFVGGVLLGIRQWKLPEAELANQGERRLRLRPEIKQNDSSRLVSSFDRGFNRLVFDAGQAASPNVVFLMIVALGVLLPGGLAFILTEQLLPAAAAAVCGALVGGAALMILRSRRRQRAIEQLPDAADMLARAVRAGEALEPAIEKIALKTDGPLGQALKLAARQMHLGLGVERALRELENQFPLVDMRVFVTSLLAYRQAGGNLPMALERMATTVRERIAFRRQVRAMTSSARMSAVVIAAAAPGLLIYYLFHERYGPLLTTDPTGTWWLASALGLELVGLAWLLSLARRPF